MAALNYTPIDDLVKKHNDAKLGGHSGSKESEPGRSSIEVTPVPESAENTSQVDPNSFVEVKTEDITLDEELKTAGVQAVTDLSIAPYLTVNNLPITDQRVMEGLKQPINKPIRWLAAIAMYLFWRAHIQLKTVHGKVVRVFRH